MTRASLLLACLLLASHLQSPAPRITTVRNPVIPGMHPDPSVVRVGTDYYLVNSTFEFFPGVPVYHSRDLVNWRPIGHALTRASQVPLAGVRESGGIFAPTIKYHDGTFYMVTTNVTGGGNFFVTATNPAGPWSEPVYIREQGGIDPSLFFDDDGTVYLTTNGPGAGGDRRHGIYQSTIDVRTGRLLSAPRHIWTGTGGRYPEGPHLYRVNGKYYLLISEGGTEDGHMVTIARSASPWGPFDPCPRNPILTHRNTEQDQPVQGTGHADLVQDHEDRWMVFLAFRPQDGYFHHLGRETFLAPVTWKDDGWPLVNGGAPVGLELAVEGLPAHPWEPPPVRDEFDRPLGFAWNYLRNPDGRLYSTTARAGWLTLNGSDKTLAADDSPAFVGRRQQDLDAHAVTRMEFQPGRPGDEAGVAVFHNGTHRYEIGVRGALGGREVFVRQTIGPTLSAITATARISGPGQVLLDVRATPLEYVFAWAPDGEPLREIGRPASTRYLSSEVAGGFTGVYLGLYATGNGQAAAAPAYFDWFEYSGPTR